MSVKIYDSELQNATFSCINRVFFRATNLGMSDIVHKDARWVLYTRSLTVPAKASLVIVHKTSICAKA
jgi:hypothetical protein